MRVWYSDTLQLRRGGHPGTNGNQKPLGLLTHRGIEPRIAPTYAWVKGFWVAPQIPLQGFTSQRTGFNPIPKKNTLCAVLIVDPYEVGEYSLRMDGF